MQIIDFAMYTCLVTYAILLILSNLSSETSSVKTAISNLEMQKKNWIMRCDIMHFHQIRPYDLLEDKATVQIRNTNSKLAYNMLNN